MTEAPAGQEYGLDRIGRRVAAHTPRLKSACACKNCWAKRWWTPERRAARAADLRQQYADGRRQPRHDLNDVRAARWRAEEDAYLRSLVGRHDCLTIASLLTERFGYPRTEAAVTHRVRTLGISRMDVRPLSSSEVGRIFGISRETVRARFVNRGLLVGQLRRGGPHGMRMFARAELEQLVRDHPEAYNVEAIRDPALRALAEAVARGRRLLGSSEVRRLTGVDVRQLLRWYADGLVPSARRVAGVRFGRGGGWLIEAADLAVIRQLDAERTERRRRREESCRSGHPRSPENLFVESSTGQRRCRACRAERYAQRAS